MYLVLVLRIRLPSPAAAWYFSSFVGSFFTPQGEKRPYRSKILVFFFAPARAKKNTEDIKELGLLGGVELHILEPQPQGQRTGEVTHQTVANAGVGLA